MKHNVHRFFDPLYGTTELSYIEHRLVMSPEIQRLRYVRLCNINSLLITGASEISRYEHVLGVLRLAKEWVEYQEPQANIPAVEFISAALLHDVQTGPFGHSLQYVLEDNQSDEDFIHDDLSHGSSLQYHQSTEFNSAFCGRPFSSKNILKDSWADVASLIRGEGELGPLISGSMDLDNIDNVIRLAYHVGVATTDDSLVALGLARTLRTVGGQLSCPQATIPSVVRWHDIRKRLYELLLLDWAEFSAKAMLTRAMELAVDYQILGADTWLKTDLEFYSFLEKESMGEAQEIGVIIKRIKVGDLFQPIAMIRTSCINKYELFSTIESKRVLEAELSALLHKTCGIKTNCLIHPILDVKKTMRAVSILIEETREPITVGVDSSQLLIGVFIPGQIIKDGKYNSVNTVTKNFLADQGLTDIASIEDPLIDRSEVQLKLL